MSTTAFKLQSFMDSYLKASLREMGVNFRKGSTGECLSVSRLETSASQPARLTSHLPHTSGVVPGGFLSQLPSHNELLARVIKPG